MPVEAPKDLTVVVLSPGQGNQRPGMGQRLAERSPAARRVWNIANDVLRSHLGENLSDIVWNGSDEQLQDTRIAQPAIVVDSLARKAAADEIGILGNPQWYGYLSLGSVSSLVNAGALTIEGAAQLTADRGETFNYAIEDHPPTSMVALLGVDAVARESIIAKHNLVICLENTGDEIVIGGLVPDLTEAIKDLSQQGFSKKQVFLLRVGAAFHSRFMEPAQQRWEKVVDAAPIEAPKYGHLVGGTTVTTLDTAEKIRSELKLQLTRCERYKDVVRFLYDMGVKTFIELNDFKRLTGMNIDLLGVDSQRRLLYPAEEGEKGITIAYELVVP